MSTISRRAFLKTVGVGALSVAAVSVLAGCDIAKAPTETTPSTAIPAELGRPYFVGDCDVTIASSSALTWNHTWETGFVKGLEGGAFYSSPSSTSSEMQKDADGVVTWHETNAPETDAQKAALLNACKVSANKEAEVELVKVVLGVNNYGETDVVLGTSALTADPDAANVANGTTEIKTNTSVFAATCNGSVLPCALKLATAPAILAAGTKSQTANVALYIAAPVNAKEITLTVALPGAEKVLSYTLENDGYLDLSKL